RLPAQVPSAGSRLEPNLELLASLKPQLIIISPTLLPMRASLQRIAPVLNIDAYQPGQDHAQAAERILLQLGRVLGRQPQAQRLELGGGGKPAGTGPDSTGGGRCRRLPAMGEPHACRRRCRRPAAGWNPIWSCWPASSHS
ncbi:ABC transporter substrate-binding protein, partial [Aquitalea magnusonii]|uniref:ABC transporter substrate-binding protein n=1 Tax=Aquitalea magnusonii TaxID=332411 RepID=UPI00128EB4DC